MGRKKTDFALRERLGRWVQHFMDIYGVTKENQGEFAERLGISGPALSQYKNARRTMGLDTFVKMHRSMKVSADVMLSADPPPRHIPAEASGRPPAPTRRSRAKGEPHNHPNRE
jgi:transcriptional regulator with XRE-family HTH domain